MGKGGFIKQLHIDTWGGVGLVRNNLMFTGVNLRGFRYLGKGTSCLVVYWELTIEVLDTWGGVGL